MGAVPDVKSVRDLGDVTEEGAWEVGEWRKVEAEEREVKEMVESEDGEVEDFLFKMWSAYDINLIRQETRSQEKGP